MLNANDRIDVHFKRLVTKSSDGTLLILRNVFLGAKKAITEHTEVILSLLAKYLLQILSQKRDLCTHDGKKT